LESHSPATNSDHTPKSIRIKLVKGELLPIFANFFSKLRLQQARQRFNKFVYSQTCSFGLQSQISFVSSYFFICLFSLPASSLEVVAEKLIRAS